MAEVNGALQLQWIERPPLAAANTSSTHQSRGTACAVAHQPLLSAAEADPSLSSQEGEAFTVVQVSVPQPVLAKGGQPSLRVGKHGK